jgi:hypothetical protein
MSDEQPKIYILKLKDDEITALQQLLETAQPRGIKAARLLVDIYDEVKNSKIV